MFKQSIFVVLIMSCSSAASTVCALEQAGEKSFVNVVPGANLSHKKMNRVQLAGKNLDGIKLIRTKLHQADLSNSSLQGAKMAFSELHESNLSYADLQNANLREANLYKVDLRGADLRGANLRNARLAGASLGQAKFNDKTILPFGKAKALELGMQYLP